jgi:hypothetical protein
MLLRPGAQVLGKVQSMKWQVLRGLNVHVYPESQILARLHSSSNLLIEENSIIIRGFLSRIQRLQDKEETSIIAIALSPHSFIERLSWKHRLPNLSRPFLVLTPYPMSLTSWPP